MSASEYMLLAIGFSTYWKGMPEEKKRRFEIHVVDLHSEIITATLNFDFQIQYREA